MSLARQVFDTAEPSCDLGAVLQQVLCLVKDIDAKVDAIRTEHEDMKEQVKCIDAKFNTMDAKMSAVVTKGDSVDAMMNTMNVKMAAMDAKVDSIEAVVNTINAKLYAVKMQESCVVLPVKDGAKYGCITQDCKNHHKPEKNKLVQEYTTHEDWDKLKTSLGVILNHSGVVYEQLHVTKSVSDVGWYGHTQLASLLFCAGLSVDSVDSCGDNMLHGAAIGGRLQFVKQLLERGAHINMRDKDGCTPLVLAAEIGHLEVVQCLLQAGADTTLRDNKGHSYITCQYDSG